MDVKDWNFRVWECCGRFAADAPPCAAGPHASFDQEWSRFDDRLARRLVLVRPGTEQQTSQEGEQSAVVHQQGEQSAVLRGGEDDSMGVDQRGGDEYHRGGAVKIYRLHEAGMQEVIKQG